MADMIFCGSIFTQFLVAGSRDPAVSGLRGARSPNLNMKDTQFRGASIYIVGFLFRERTSVFAFH